MPIDGELASEKTADGLAEREVAVCGPDDRVADVRRRIKRAGAQESVVVNSARVVEGLVAAEAWQKNGTAAIEEIMDPAPLTVRPHVAAQTAAERMRKQKRDIALVTTPDGKLIGILRREA